MKERSIKSRKQNLKCVNSECATFESNAKRCLLCVTCFFLHLRIYGYVIAVPSEPRGLGGPIFQQIGTLTLFELEVGTALCVQMDFTWTFQITTKCNNINHVWNHFYKILVVLKYHICLWANIFETDIIRSINIPKKAKDTTLM